MNPAQWARVREAFEAALELPGEVRDACLQRQLGGEPELLAEVRAMLAAEPDAREYLTPPGAVTLGAAGAASHLLGVRPGDRLGAYELLRPIGSGGMGAVFEARREKPARTVALKVMRDAFGSESARRRFLDEIELLAKLQHPGIAAVFEAGTDGDVPWFAMELLESAAPVTDFANARALDAGARIDLLLQVAAAVQHAHQRGVIHRDLKPANILVDAAGRAKVIDFGIARSVARDLDQRTTASPGQVLGTLLYTSPERLAGTGDDADVRSDVYGLGVVLYELLARRRPFDFAGTALADACRAVLEVEPPAPGTLVPGIARELDWIVGRAMAKDRERRYASVADLAADLHRFRRHEPVLAAPPSRAYRLRKFLRRHRAGSAAAVAVLAVTIAAFVAVTDALWRARAAEAAERTRGQEARASARRAETAKEFLLDVFAVAAPGATKKGKDVTMGDALERASRTLATRLADAPDLRADLGSTIGMAWYGLGDAAAAEQHLRDALAARRQLPSGDELATAQLHMRLGTVLLQGGRFDEVQAELDEAARILERHPDSREAAVLQADRGELLLARGEKERAKEVLTAAVASLRERFGEDDGETLLATNLLAGALHQLGQLDAAEPLYRRALQGLTALKGEEHPSTLAAMNNLAMVLFSRQPSADSVAMLERVLRVRIRVLGGDHPDTVMTRVNLGGQHFLRKDVPAALAHWEQALQDLGGKLPREHPVMQTLLVNIATAERDRGNFARAIELNDEVLALRRRTLGADHEKTLVAVTSLADICRGAGQVERAEQLFREGLTAAQDRQPPDLVAIYRCNHGLGRIARDRGDFAAAERALLACHAAFDATVATMSVKSLLTPCEPDLQVLYETWGKPEQAAHWRGVVEAAAKARGAAATGN